MDCGALLSQLYKITIGGIFYNMYIFKSWEQMNTF